jgi:peptidyl-prolyl cis-trans isomerase SurA
VPFRFIFAMRWEKFKPPICRRIVAGGVSLAAALAILAAPPLAAQQVVDRVIASVDGEPITMHDVRAFSAANGAPIPDPSDPRASDMIRKALKGVIEEKLLESETRSFESQVDETQVDKFIERIKQQSNMNDQQFREELLKSGISYEEMRKRARVEIEKMMMLDRDVRSKVNVSDAEVKAYYNAHLDEFTNKAERFRLAQIMIAAAPGAPAGEIAAAKAKAEMVRKRAAKGEDFGALAAEFSDDDSKKKGGELGYFAPDEMLDEIRAAVEKLKPGEVTPVIQTSHGFHIVKVEEHELAGPKPLGEVQDEIRQRLTDAKAKEHFQQFLDEDLVKNHHVESFY